jgi:hypothetical protein
MTTAHLTEKRTYKNSLPKIFKNAYITMTAFGNQARNQTPPKFGVELTQFSLSTAKLNGSFGLSSDSQTQPKRK